MKNITSNNKYNIIADYSKYRLLISSLFLFSILVVSIMTLNLYVSNQLEKDTKVINTAFEQVSLINQLISDLYIINSQYNAGQASSFVQERLKETTELIDKRMVAFRDGGALPVVGVGNNNQHELVDISPVKDVEILSNIDLIWNLWEEYKRRIDPAIIFDSQRTVFKTIFDRYQFYGAVLYNQGAISGLNRINLQNKLEILALQLQSESDARLNFLRVFQFLGIIFTALSFVLILFFVVRQLHKSDTALEEAREESKGILSTVNEGLFLIHEDRSISNEYSQKLESIVGYKDIANKNIFEFMKRFISDKDEKNLKSFINALFNEDIVEELIQELNPVKEVRLPYIDSEDEKEDAKERILNFDFYRVIKKGKIKDILVSVKDVTDSTLLKEKLNFIEYKSQEKIKSVIVLASAHNSEVKDLLKSSSIKINLIKSKISNRQTAEVDVDKILSDIYWIKSRFLDLGLSDVVKKADAFSSQLKLVKRVDMPTESDISTLRENLFKFYSSIDWLSKVSKKIYSGQIENQAKSQ